MMSLIHIIDNSSLQPTSEAAAHLERAHDGVRYALSEIASEGTLDFEVIDDVARALVAALREIEGKASAIVRAFPYDVCLVPALSSRISMTGCRYTILNRKDKSSSDPVEIEALRRRL